MSSVIAVADVSEGLVTATVEIIASPERVFKALSTAEITKWWLRPGVMETHDWTGDVRVGGKWTASGIGNENPFTLEGEFREVDPPRKLVHTWQIVGAPVPPSIVIYVLERIENGTRLTLRHTGLLIPEICNNTVAAWETSLTKLSEILNISRVCLKRE